MVELIVVEVLVVVVVSCVCVWGAYRYRSRSSLQARSVHHVAVHSVAWPHNPSTASVGTVEQGDSSGVSVASCVGRLGWDVQS